MIKLLPYPKFFDRIPVKINLTQGTNENGAPNIVQIYVGNCRFNNKVISKRLADGQLIQLSGKIYIGKDIAPTMPLLEGSVELFGQEYKIYSGKKLLNPDGSVHHVELELI